jgi:hypothetical protein
MTPKRIFWGVGALCGLVAANAFAIGDGGPKNGLSSQAFLNNALTSNPVALQLLATQSLQEVFSSSSTYIIGQLHDPAARAMATEIVSCALDGNTTVSYRDGSALVSFTGELGICQGPSSGAAGNWYTAPPTPECQRLVTACVMARVNALHQSVPLALRSPSAAWAQPGDPVPTVRQFRESPLQDDPSQGSPIPSFGPLCSAIDPDCNWTAAQVGTCGQQAGARIRLTLDSPVPSGSQLRICDGIYGCTSPRPAVLFDGTSPAYSKTIKEFALSGSASTSVEFDCQSNYYSVMFHSATHSPPPKLHASAGTSYPASASQVFGFVEGAFFGNLFDPDKLTQSCVSDGRNTITCQPTKRVIPKLGDARSGAAVTQPGDTTICRVDGNVRFCDRPTTSVPYGDVHACYSFAQQMDSQLGDLGVAYLNRRICDLPDGGGHCFPEPPVPCQGPSTDSAHCTWSDSTGSFTSCQSRGTAPVSFAPVTSYLNAPCDLIGPGELCNKVKPLIQPPGPIAGSCRQGCARSASAGDALIAILIAAAVLIFVLRRRRDTASVGGRAP